jgi:hypothetical protein
MQRLPIKPDLTPQTLYNPDRETFTFTYDGGKEVYTLYPMSYDEFPAYIARKIANALADKIIGKDGVKNNYTQDKEELLKRIIIV